MSRRQPPNPKSLAETLSVICHCMNKKDIGGGLIVIAIGLIFLAVNYDVMPAQDIGRLWPLILVVIGASQMLFPGDEGRWGGLPLLFVGGIFLAHNYDVMRLKQSWPLFIVAAGLSILVSSRCGIAAKGGQ
jgi:hypothetical protein